MFIILDHSCKLGVSVQIAVIRVFMAHTHSISVTVVLLLEMGGNQINKDPPATTTVLD